jgi:D-alanyl-D-alanine carboxypeptidase/D-alanyl-D-alanine-endopeptidase (penicillin-binding protein 4)
MPVHFRPIVLLLLFLIASSLNARALKNVAIRTQSESQRLLKRELEFLIRTSSTTRTIKAIEVYSRRNKRVLYKSNSQLLLHPASNLKILTTSFALQSLGWNYKFNTAFLISDKRNGDSVIDNLIVETSGDPIISHDDLDSVARAILQSGIRNIHGNIIINTSMFDSLQWGSGWMWDDEPSDYQMFISPACLDHNIITVCISLDSLGRLSVLTRPETSFIHILSSATLDTIDSLCVTRTMENDTNTILVSGKYSPHLNPFEKSFSVRHPAAYFGTVLKESLERHGIKIDGKIVINRGTLANVTHAEGDTLFSLEHSLDSIVTFINKESDNLGAECLLRKVPYEICGETGSAENGIELEKVFLSTCGVDSTEYYIVDGSGLSHYDLITPEAVIKVLNHNLDQPFANVFLRSLPVNGKDGTLRKRMTWAFLSGRIIAKTGSINGVSTLSGYVLIPKDTLIFSMMMQNFLEPGDSVRTLEDNLCTVLALYNDNVRSFVNNLKRYHIGTYGRVYRKHLH